MSKKSKMDFFEKFNDEAGSCSTRRRGGCTSDHIIKNRGSLTANCEECGEQYRINTITQKYCSKKCYRKKERNQRKTQSRGINKIRFLVFNRDNFRCIYCGRAPWNTDNLILHLDHIHPSSKGGDDTINNLVTSCSECNVAKGANLVYNEEEMLAEIRKRNKQIGTLKEKLNDS